MMFDSPTLRVTGFALLMACVGAPPQSTLSNQQPTRGPVIPLQPAAPLVQIAKAPAVSARSAAPPTPPPLSPVDPKVNISLISLLGTTDTQALLLAPERDDEVHFLVADLKTACVTESYRRGRALQALYKEAFRLLIKTNPTGPLPEPLGELPMDEAVRKVLNTPEASQEIRDIVGLVNRFGVSDYMPIAWSPGGPDVFVVAGLLYRSRDGGRTFTTVDNHPASNVKVSPDGKFATYERCRDPEARPGTPVCRGQQDIVALPLDGDSEPHLLRQKTGTPGYVFDEGFTKDGHVILWETDIDKGCMLFVKPENGYIERKVCFSDPHFAETKHGKRTGRADLVKWDGLSADEQTGAIEWTSTNAKSLTWETVVLDMKAGRIARVLPDWQFRFIGDQQTVMVQSWSRGSDAKYIVKSNDAMRLAFSGPLMDWDAKRGRAVIYEWADPRVSTTLGASACKLIRVRTLR
jgi:hypothetical protein